jgi:hypothetical protein
VPAQLNIRFESLFEASVVAFRFHGNRGLSRCAGKKHGREKGDFILKYFHAADLVRAGPTSCHAAPNTLIRG